MNVNRRLRIVTRLEKLLREFNRAGNCEFTAVENLNCNACTSCINDSVCECRRKFAAWSAERTRTQKDISKSRDPRLMPSINLDIRN